MAYIFNKYTARITRTALLLLLSVTFLALIALRTTGVLADVGNPGGDGYTETCFVKGTRISTPEGNKAIEDLAPGDSVISWDEKNTAFRIGKITFLDRPRLGSRKIYAINGKVRATSEHPFRAKDKNGSESWRSVDPKATARENASLRVETLSVGDFLLRADGSWEKIESISVDESHKNPDETLYNFGVDGGTPTYVAEGYVVHNKGGQGGGGDPGETAPPGMAGYVKLQGYPDDVRSECVPGPCKTAPSGNQSYWCFGGWCHPTYGGGGFREPRPPPGYPAASGRQVVVKATAVVAGKQYMSRCSDLVQIKKCLETNAPADCMVDGQAIEGEKKYPFGINLLAIWGSGEVPLAMADGADQWYSWTLYDNKFLYFNSTLYANYSPYLYCKCANPKGTAAACANWTEYAVQTPIDLTTLESIGFIAGYSKPVLPWWQVTGGGNTNATDTFASLLPLNALSRTPILYFDTSVQEKTGIISGKKDAIDLSQSPSIMTSIISSKNDWVTDQGVAKDWYSIFYTRANSAVKTPYTLAGTKPSMVQGQTTSVFDVTGDMILQGAWTIGNGESMIFLIPGNLTLNGKVNITGTGFIAFIVKGNITVGSTVGSAWDSTTDTPQIEGVYIAKGTFKTGLSTVAGKERFIGKGTFAANTIIMQRSFENITGGNKNNDKSTELFIYNPNLMMRLPRFLQDISFRWQEIAP